MNVNHAIILISGRKGVGKDAVKDFLMKSNPNAVILRFADKMKDSLSITFRWNRAKLDGLNEEDRIWRETPDPFWSRKLGMRVTPRSMMELYGTDAIRKGIHFDFWVIALHREIEEYKTPTLFIIPDLRFWNEYILTKLEYPTYVLHLTSKRNLFDPQLKNDAYSVLNNMVMGNPLLISQKYLQIINGLKPILGQKEHQSEWENILIEYANDVNKTNITNNYNNLEELQHEVIKCLSKFGNINNFTMPEIGTNLNEVD